MLNHLFLILFRKVINYTNCFLIAVLVIINIISCTSDIKKNKNDNKNIEKKAKTEQIQIINGPMDKKLAFYYDKAVHSNGNIKAKYEQLFFDAFPSSFVEMKKLFGVTDNNKTGVFLSDYKKGEEILSYFQGLKSIEPEKYYKKYIDICINGKYEADFISDGFGIEKILIEDTQKFISLLSQYTDYEIISVFKFIFDGEPTPTYKYFNKLYELINPINHRVAMLMKKAFEERISLIH
jgi:hypothetical protein